MGLMQTMAISDAMSGVIPYGFADGMFITLVAMLAIAFGGILLSVPRRSSLPGLRVVRSPGPAGMPVEARRAA